MNLSLDSIATICKDFFNNSFKADDELLCSFLSNKDQKYIFIFKAETEEVNFTNTFLPYMRKNCILLVKASDDTIQVLTINDNGNKEYNDYVTNILSVFNIVVTAVLIKTDRINEQLKDAFFKLLPLICSNRGDNLMINFHDTINLKLLDQIKKYEADETYEFKLDKEQLKEALLKDQISTLQCDKLLSEPENIQLVHKTGMIWTSAMQNLMICLKDQICIAELVRSASLVLTNITHWIDELENNIYSCFVNNLLLATDKVRYAAVNYNNMLKNKEICNLIIEKLINISSIINNMSLDESHTAVSLINIILQQLLNHDFFDDTLVNALLNSIFNCVLNEIHSKLISLLVSKNDDSSAINRFKTWANSVSYSEFWFNCDQICITMKKVKNKLMSKLFELLEIESKIINAFDLYYSYLDKLKLIDSKLSQNCIKILNELSNDKFFLQRFEDHQNSSSTIQNLLLSYLSNEISIDLVIEYYENEKASLNQYKSKTKHEFRQILNIAVNSIKQYLINSRSDSELLSKSEYVASLFSEFGKIEHGCDEVIMQLFVSMLFSYKDMFNNCNNYSNIEKIVLCKNLIKRLDDLNANLSNIFGSDVKSYTPLDNFFADFEKLQNEIIESIEDYNVVNAQNLAKSIERTFDFDSTILILLKNDNNKYTLKLMQNLDLFKNARVLAYLRDITNYQNATDFVLSTRTRANLYRISKLYSCNYMLINTIKAMELFDELMQTMIDYKIYNNVELLFNVDFINIKAKLSILIETKYNDIDLGNKIILFDKAVQKIYTKYRYILKLQSEILAYINCNDFNSALNMLRNISDQYVQNYIKLTLNVNFADMLNKYFSQYQSEFNLHQYPNLICLDGKANNYNHVWEYYNYQYNELYMPIELLIENYYSIIDVATTSTVNIQKNKEACEELIEKSTTFLSNIVTEFIRINAFSNTINVLPDAAGVPLIAQLFELMKFIGNEILNLDKLNKSLEVVNNQLTLNFEEKYISLYKIDKANLSNSIADKLKKKLAYYTNKYKEHGMQKLQYIDSIISKMNFNIDTYDIVQVLHVFKNMAEIRAVIDLFDDSTITQYFPKFLPVYKAYKQVFISYSVMHKAVEIFLVGLYFNILAIIYTSQNRKELITIDDPECSSLVQAQIVELMQQSINKRDEELLPDEYKNSIMLNKIFNYSTFCGRSFEDNLIIILEKFFELLQYYNLSYINSKLTLFNEFKSSLDTIKISRRELEEYKYAIKLFMLSNCMSLSKSEILELYNKAKAFEFTTDVSASKECEYYKEKFNSINIAFINLLYQNCLTDKYWSAIKVATDEIDLENMPKREIEFYCLDKVNGTAVNDILAGHLEHSSSFMSLKPNCIYVGSLLYIRVIVETIINQANAEYQIIESINEIKNIYNNLLYIVNEHKQYKINFVTNIMAITGELEQALVQLNTSSSSPHANNILHDINLWENIIINASIFNNLLLDVQQKFLYLKGVFNDAKKLFPSYFDEFMSCEKDLQSILMKKGSILMVEIVDKLGMLENIKNKLNVLEKNLTTYIQKQRELYPKFFFIGEESLLELLGQKNNLQIINKYIKKIHHSIKSLNSSSDNAKLITSVTSLQDEVILLEKPFNIESMQLSELFDLIEKTLEIKISNSIYQFSNRLISSFKTAKNVDIFSYFVEFEFQAIFVTLLWFFPNLIKHYLFPDNHASNFLLLDSSLREIDIDNAEISLNQTIKTLVDKLNEVCTYYNTCKYRNLLIILSHIKELLKNARLLCDSTIYEKESLFTKFLWYDSTFTNNTANIHLCSNGYKIKYYTRYLGCPDLLIHTDVCMRALVALFTSSCNNFGSAFTGPAGTGKTETVKLISFYKADYLLIFNCDDLYDSNSLKRLLVGILKTNSSVCFDEFNRINTKTLSVMRHEIAKMPSSIYLTMNLGYAGRNQLPNSIKRLFRINRIEKPDILEILIVSYFIHGFYNTEILAKLTNSIYTKLEHSLSKCEYYDFGLRSIKALLGTCKILNSQFDDNTTDLVTECRLLYNSFTTIMYPVLKTEDKQVFIDILNASFSEYVSTNEMITIQHKTTTVFGTYSYDTLSNICSQLYLNLNSILFEKGLELINLLTVKPAVIVLGDSMFGKSTLIKIVSRSLHNITLHYIYPNAYTKEQLIGYTDNCTLEWCDGCFTNVLRSTLNYLESTNENSHSPYFHWFIFDGVLSSDWSELLNSVLDDNRVLTLSNGEHLNIPSNIKFIFEINSLTFVTMATVSRCGILNINNYLYTTEDLINYIFTKDFKLALNAANFKENLSIQSRLSLQKSDISNLNIKETKEELNSKNLIFVNNFFKDILSNTNVYRLVYNVIKSLDGNKKMMNLGYRNFLKVICSFLVTIAMNIDKIFNANYHNNDETKLKEIFAIVVVITVGSIVEEQECYLDIERKIIRIINEELNCSITETDTVYSIYSEIFNQYIKKDSLQENEYIENNAIKTGMTNIVETISTLIIENTIEKCIQSNETFVLCGPAGSGKSMIIEQYVRKNSGRYKLKMISFNSETSSELLYKLFDYYCVFTKSTSGYTMQPATPGKKLILLCDEMNLPKLKNSVVSSILDLIRSIIESNSFYRLDIKTGTWSLVKVVNVYVCGSCNPPNTSARYPFADNLLSKITVLAMRFPTYDDMIVIYSNFLFSILNQYITDEKELKQAVNLLSTKMVEYYIWNKTNFNLKESHYTYSPRDLSRWIIAIETFLKNSKIDVHSFKDENNSLLQMIAHEGIRVFADRLVDDDDKRNCISQAEKIFGVNNLSKCLYTNLITGSYEYLEYEIVKNYIASKANEFCKKKINLNLIMFNECVLNILNLHRCINIPCGHLILIGASGSGKTILTKFVAFLNNYELFEIRPALDYKITAYENDIKKLIKLTGMKKRKVCFLFDETNFLNSGYIELINTLLISGEVPGLFEGEDYVNLINEYKQMWLSTSKLVKDSDIYIEIQKNVRMNLNTVFTMNPQSNMFVNREKTSSALFNRCIVNWYRKWSNNSLYEVCKQIIKSSDIDKQLQSVTNDVYTIDKISSDLVDINNALVEQKIITSYTPREFVSFTHCFIRLTNNILSKASEILSTLKKGTERIEEANNEVNALTNILKANNAELRLQQEVADNKMKEIAQKQVELTEKKGESEILIEQSRNLLETIEENQKIIERERNEILPAFQEAKQNISNNTKEIDNVRTLKNPADIIQKLVIIAVKIITVNINITTWSEARPKIVSNFSNRIKNFDIETLTNDVRENIENELITSNITLDRVTSAGVVAKALFLWIESTLTYAKVNKKLEHFDEKIQSSTKEKQSCEMKLKQLEGLIIALNDDKVKLEDSYRQQIELSTKLKININDIEERLNNGKTIVKNLQKEYEQWNSNLTQYDTIINKLYGNFLLCTVFISYFGGFSNKERNKYLQVILSYLKYRRIEASLENCVQITSALNMNNFGAISSNFQASSVTVGLNEQNEEILNNTINYPLIIDSQNLSTNSIKKFIDRSNRQFQTTQIYNTNFVKHLTNAIKIGTILLVEDTTIIPPLMYNILNKELSINNDGRIVINVENDEIQFNDSFFIIFIAKSDAAIAHSIDITSRINIINFNNSISILDQKLNKLILNIIDDRILINEQKYSVDILEYNNKQILVQSKLLNFLNSNTVETILNRNTFSNLNDLFNESKIIFESLQTILEGYEEHLKLSQKIAEGTNKLLEVSKIIYQLIANYFGDKTIVLDYYLKIFSHIIIDFNENENLKNLDTSKNNKFIKSLTSYVISIFATLIDDEVVKLQFMLDIIKIINIKLYSCVVLIDAKIDELLNNITEAKLEELKNIDFKTNEFNLTNDADYIELATMCAFILKYNRTYFFDFVLKLVNRYFDLLDINLAYKFIFNNLASSETAIALTNFIGVNITTFLRNYIEFEENDLAVLSIGDDESNSSILVEFKALFERSCIIVIENIDLADENFLNQVVFIIRNTKTNSKSKIILTSDYARIDLYTLAEYSITIRYKKSNTLYSLTTQLLRSNITINKNLPRIILANYIKLLIYHSILLYRLHYVPSSFKKVYEISDNDFIVSTIIINKWLNNNIAIIYNIYDLNYSQIITEITDQEYAYKLLIQLFNNNQYTLIKDLDKTELNNITDIENFLKNNLDSSDDLLHADLLLEDINKLALNKVEIFLNNENDRVRTLVNE